MLPVPVRKYLLTSVASTPEVLEALVEGISATDPVWDVRPYADRFTLREVVAHLADWEPIHKERIERILSEDEPTLPDMDEGQMAIDNDYAHQDPINCLKRYREGRKVVVGLLKSLSPEQCERAGIRPPNIGRLDLDQFATFIFAHDGYHLQQAAEYRKG